MKKLLLVFLLSGSIATAASLEGLYKAVVTDYASADTPIDYELNIKVNNSGTWYIACEQQFGDEVYSYPCEGKMFTWSRNNRFVNQDLSLDFPGIDIPCRILSDNSLACRVQTMPIALYLEKAPEESIQCKAKIVEPEEGFEHPASAGTFSLFIATSKETCAQPFIYTNSSDIRLVSIRYLDTGDLIATMGITSNTTNANRNFTVELRPSINSNIVIDSVTIIQSN